MLFPSVVEFIDAPADAVMIAGERGDVGPCSFADAPATAHPAADKGG